MLKTLAVLIAMLPVAAPATPCRQALALGLDVSGSVDGAEYRLQLDGLAAALSDPAVVRVLLSGAGAPVRLLVYEWSGPQSWRQLAGWSEIRDAASLQAFTDTLRSTQRRVTPPSTAIGSAVLRGAELLAEQSACWTRTLDISGDGMSNTGPRPQDISGAALSGITVNALVIGHAEGVEDSSFGDLVGYFRAYVIRGPDAFVEHAADFAAYEAAMRKKLLRELEGMVVGQADLPSHPGQ